MGAVLLSRLGKKIRNPLICIINIGKIRKKQKKYESRAEDGRSGEGLTQTRPGFQLGPGVLNSAALTGAPCGWFPGSNRGSNRTEYWPHWEM